MKISLDMPNFKMCYLQIQRQISDHQCFRGHWGHSNDKKAVDNKKQLSNNNIIRIDIGKKTRNKKINGKSQKTVGKILKDKL